MAFEPVCPERNLREGELWPCRIDGREVLLIRLHGDRLKAYCGECPHHGALLRYGRFDGRTLTCALHDWAFDVVTGQRIRALGRALESFQVRVRDGVIEVDVHAHAQGFDGSS